ncbi:MAG: ABC transporter ATP-binding protein [Actinobacteria bacterium]|nr:ABC transporter ATP-binding protein [Actinomycetota bacterium]
MTLAGKALLPARRSTGTAAVVDERPPAGVRLLEVEDLTVSYGGVRALSGVSIVVPKGSVVALLGPNGAGKTTMLRTISGLVRPDRGHIRLAGRDITGWAPHRVARLGVLHVPEGRGVFPSLSVEENLLMAAYALNGSDDVVARGVELFPQLGTRLGQLARSLSGGEQQMLALARALLAKPRLVMLDEISMGLAPIIVTELLEAVKKMAQEGVTALIVEQYVEAALGMSDYAYLLDKGRLLTVGEPEDLKRSGMLSMYLGG